VANSVYSDESVLAEIMHNEAELNGVIINVQLLLASLYRIMHFKKSGHHKFVTELLVFIPRHYIVMS
jgi:hypothetical protein